MLYSIVPTIQLLVIHDVLYWKPFKSYFVRHISPYIDFSHNFWKHFIFTEYISIVSDYIPINIDGFISIFELFIAIYAIYST